MNKLSAHFGIILFVLLPLALPVHAAAQGAVLDFAPLTVNPAALHQAEPIVIDTRQWEVSLVAALDGGPVFGGALSYKLAQFGGTDWLVFLDGGLKRVGSTTDMFAGASTSIPYFEKILPLGTR